MRYNLLHILKHSLFLLLSVVVIRSSAQNYFFKNYNVEDGLPGVQVYTIFQDRMGYLWSGGYGGLSKFNGKQFEIFSPKNGLANNFVKSINQDEVGNLWIATIKGISIYDYKKFKTLSVKDGLPSNSVNFLLPLSKNKMLICTDAGICMAYDQNIEPINNPTLNKCIVNTAIIDNITDVIWLGTNKGFFKYEKNQIVQITNTNGLDVKSIVRVNNSLYYLGTTKGVWQLNGAQLFPLKCDEALDKSVINGMYFSSQSSLWIASSSGLYNLKNNSIKKYAPKEDINSNNVFCIYIDREKNKWIGTYNGLFRYRGNAFETFNQNQGLNSPFIYGLLYDDKNNLWLGTNGSGIVKYSNNIFTYYTTKDGLSDNSVNTLVNMGKKILVGTNKGLCVLKDNKIITLSHCGGLENRPIHILVYDKDSTLWIGSGNQLYTRTSYTFEPIETKIIPTNAQITAVQKDKNGSVWVGTYLGGIYKLTQNKLVDYTKVIGKTSDSFLSIAIDKHNVMYVASFEGLIIYDGKTTKTINQQSGLSSDLVYSLLLDDDDNTLWVGTNQGLNKLDLKILRSQNRVSLTKYSKDDGFNGVECNSNSILKDPQKNIWFGTVNGLIRYNPREIRYNDALSLTNIKSIKINGVDTSIASGVKLSYSENSINFSFDGICLTNPNKVLYQYYLKGYEKTWCVPTTNQNVNFPNLPAGNYTFRVRSCNNEGIWNIKPTEFVFTILIPWYKSKWAYATYVLVLGLLIYSYVAWRVKRAQQREARKTKLANYELKALRSQMNPHFIFNALNSIQHFVLNKEESLANKYLSKFAKLIRTILNNSEKTLIPLSEEITQLNLYLELEAMRFENLFSYTIEVESDINPEMIEIPTMLIQPYVENAILHGLVPKGEGGVLLIKFKLYNNMLQCTIRDNGVGRSAASELKARSINKSHRSIGTKITEDRLRLLNSVHDTQLSSTTHDLYDGQNKSEGTMVEIYIPFA